MDRRIVHCRTDESAEDFWSRIRESREVDNTNGRVKPKDTPYGRQRPPFSGVPPPTPSRTPLQSLPMNSTRVAERMVLCEEIRQNDALSILNERLRHEKAELEAQVTRLLRLNAGLANELVRLHARSDE